MTRFLGILSDEAGAGKTTTAINLAAFLAVAGKRVLLLDCGETPAASRSLGVKGAHAFPLSDAHEALAAPRCPGLDVLPLATLPAEERAQVFDGQVFRESAKGWDHVIADLGLASQRAEAWLQILDSVVVLLPAQMLSLQKLASCVQAVAEVKGGKHPALRIEGVLVTKADRTLRHFEKVMQQAGRRFPVDLFSFAILEDEALRGHERPPLVCQASGLECRASRGYVELAMEILSHER